MSDVRAGAVLAGVVLAAVVVGTGVEIAGKPEPASGDRSVYDQIWEIEREAQRHRKLAGRLDLDLRTKGEGAASVEEIFRRRKAAESAADRVRGDIVGLVGRWLGTRRRAVQVAPTLKPGQGARLDAVLDAVEGRILGQMDSKIEAWNRLRVQMARPTVLLRDRASRTVELAQHRGAEEALETQKDEVVDGADDTEDDEKSADEEREESAEKLDESMGDLMDHETGRDFHRRKGALIPPVGDEPSADYGTKKQSESMTYTRHTGLTWEVDAGSEVSAVADGLVVFAERFEGFGRMLIVDHGDDYHSVYAHLEAFDVEVGDKVGRGDVVATSGDSGSLEGPKLYFELRHEGTPIDPEPWFVESE